MDVIFHISILQGRIHAIGLCSIYNIARIYLWNRTKARAEELATELSQMQSKFVNSQTLILCADTVTSAVAAADAIVTSTYSRTPLINRSMLKDNVHINGTYMQDLFVFLIAINVDLNAFLQRSVPARIIIPNWVKMCTKIQRRKSTWTILAAHEPNWPHWMRQSLAKWAT